MNDNGALTIRDQQNRQVDSPEQYAVNVQGDGALKTANKVIKEGKRIADNTKAPVPAVSNSPYREKKYIKVDRQKQRKSFVQEESVQQQPDISVNVSTAEPENPAEMVHENTSAPCHAEKTVKLAYTEPHSTLPPQDYRELTNLPRSTNQPGLINGNSFSNTSIIPSETSSQAAGSVPRESSLRLMGELQLSTWENDPLTSSLQNQGVALAVAGDINSPAQSFQAVHRTAEDAGASVANAAASGVAYAIQATEKVIAKVKETVENIAASAPKRASSMGVLAAVFLLPMFVIAAVAGSFRGGGSVRNVGLSADVLALMPQISAACQANGIPEYTQLVAAVIMQESGGRADDVGGDVMQCAEGMGLPVGTPVSVEDSIHFGTSIIAANLQAAGTTGPTDIPAISLALQGYNFGNSYISWALARGGYSKENAREFSELQAAAHGWSGYGDIDYVDHVLRYYQITAGGMGDASAIAGGRFSYPFPGHPWDTYPGHNGIDISFANCYGEPVYAVAGGTIRYTQDGWTEADGVSGMWSFGNSVFVEHGDGWISAYAHLSALVVAPGETVVQGQLVGYIGSTGNSTGPHLHLALYHNGDAGVGGQCFAEMAWPQYHE